MALNYTLTQLSEILENILGKKRAQVFYIQFPYYSEIHTLRADIAMQNFKGKVDFIYVGGSGQIQPTLSVIAQISNNMGIPVLNLDKEAVKNDMVLASFGVDYKQVGINAGKLIVQVLNGTDISKLKPIYPSAKDHHSFISTKKAEELNLKVVRK